MSQLFQVTSGFSQLFLIGLVFEFSEAVFFLVSNANKIFLPTPQHPKLATEKANWKALPSQIKRERERKKGAKNEGGSKEVMEGQMLRSLRANYRAYARYAKGALIYQTQAKQHQNHHGPKLSS